MGVRKNARFLTSAEREAFVRACVLMKADIVNPGAPAADRYSRWDESCAVHQMIQLARAPGTAGTVNFGHGGTGSYSFLSWHRYYLYRFELQLQSYVPGVMLPYWDWTDPSPLLTDDFLGPDGSPGTGIVSRGYFAADRPGSPGNPTPLPAWWPAALPGWRLPGDFGTWAGPLTRDVGGALPSAADVRAALARTTYSGFQDTLESGAGLPSNHQMHNGLHGYVGGHMSDPAASPFDPLFYLHHCNIDRLWAMWQLDGHASLYPAAGANPHHGPTDPMYPWVGTLSGYSHEAPFSTIVMPDHSALGVIRNSDTLNYRAYGYTYDTLAVIGIGLDRTGSMSGLTPDPMTGSGSVTKWEAARRGVSAFLQDAETVQSSGAVYVTAGVKTFRSLTANQFDSVFPGTPYGLIKNGTAYSRATFDGAVAAMSPGGGTPLADALQHVEDTLVEPPEGWVPADEPRYLAMLTDGMLTSGSPLASIPDGSFANTAIFAMGFGTGADVDYATLAALVAKGRTLSFSQVFHGESAGTIDKFYSNALARAIGFTTVFDPVIELFAGEHTHLDFYATSAEDVVFLTVQGMDYTDPNWSFHLEGPDGSHHYADGTASGRSHSGSHHRGERMPDVTATRSDGRLSLVVQRDSAGDALWVGRWRLMVAYRARDLSAMTMFPPGELIVPVAAGRIRGPRHERLLAPTEKTPGARAVPARARHRLDQRATSTNHGDHEACAAVVTIYARSRLRVELAPQRELARTGDAFQLTVATEALAGDVVGTRAFARLIGPATDVAGLVARIADDQVPRRARRRRSGEPGGRAVDTGILLGLLERERPELAELVDVEVPVVTHDEGAPHVHIDQARAPGGQHLGLYLEGVYCAGHGGTPDHDGHHHAPRADRPEGGRAGIDHGPACRLERFTRLLGASVATVDAIRDGTPEAAD